MFASAVILSNITQDRCKNSYVFGTLLWISLSTVIMLFLDQIVHTNPLGSFAPVKNVAALITTSQLYALCTEAISILGQSFAFVCGNLAGSAIGDPSSQNNFMWVVWAVIFQIVGLQIEAARTKYLPKAMASPASSGSTRNNRRCAMQVLAGVFAVLGLLLATRQKSSASAGLLLGSRLRA